MALVEAGDASGALRERGDGMFTLGPCDQVTDAVAAIHSNCLQAARDRITSIQLDSYATDPAILENVLAVVSGLPRLRCIGIAFSGVEGDEGSETAVLQRGGQPTGSERVVIALCAYITARNSPVTTIAIRGGRLTAAAIVPLATLISKSRCITTLDLSGNLLGANEAIALAAGLLANTSLTELCLSQNLINDAAVPMLQRALYTNRTLRKLYLTDNRLQNDGITRLASVVAPGRNTTLTHLDLNNNAISEDFFCEGVWEELAYCLTRNQHIYPRWRPETHRQYPAEAQQAMMALLTLYECGNTTLSALPLELMFVLLECVATDFQVAALASFNAAADAAGHAGGGGAELSYEALDFELEMLEMELAGQWDLDWTGASLLWAQTLDIVPTPEAMAEAIVMAAEIA